MPHDVNGNLIEKGDEVIVRFTVKDVFTGEEYCNVNLESVLGMPPNGSKLSIGAINTRQTEKVMHEPNAFELGAALRAQERPPAPPVDNAHVASGCEQFSE